MNPYLSLERQQGDEAAAQDAEAHGWTELAKLHRVAIEREIVQQFLDWLFEAKQWTICEWRSDTGWSDLLEEFGEYSPIPQSREQVIATYFDIDPQKLSQEKNDILNQLRAARATP